jgi:indolepyruvate ferredoxin oxidoreductase beta subunit
LKTNKATNILFSGIGGQGIILSSDITALAIMNAGLDVKKSEIHGMAQRGGSVDAHLRFGDKIYSPVIEKGSADIHVAFEMMESLRYLSYMKQKGMVILNTQKIPPLSVSTGHATYPTSIVDQLHGCGLDVYTVDALELARSIGELRTVNMVMVGALSHFLDIDQKLFMDMISKKIKEQFVEANIKAFNLGRHSMKLKMYQPSDVI